jgi:hypothetical protein
VDGDGTSSYGDRWVFNDWLGQGGSLEKALFDAKTDGKVLDLSAFFTSGAAALSPESPLLSASSSAGLTPAVGGGGVAAAAAGGGCPTTALILAPFGAPTTPGSLFSTCRSEYDNPTGFAFDANQKLWASTQGVSSGTGFGVTRVSLSDSPPNATNGSCPISPTLIDLLAGTVEAEDVTLRVEAGGNIDVLVSEPALDAIHRFDETLQCVELDPLTPRTDGGPAIDRPFGLAVLPAGTPGIFGPVGSPVFSENRPFSPLTPARLRRAAIAGICAGTTGNTVTNIFLLAVGLPLSVAVGSFNGAGVFGIYYISGAQVRRVRAAGAALTDELFVNLGAAAPRSLEFDPISGDLFVSENSLTPGADSIFRINAAGTVRTFGTGFTQPNGMAFHPSGVMLVSEDTSVLVVGGWRNLFLRGDANGDGAVNLSDILKIRDWAFLGLAPPACFDGADANDDSLVNGSDMSFLSNFLFLGGSPPPPPGPTSCGRDPSPDLLDCITNAGAGCPIP